MEAIIRFYISGFKGWAACASIFARGRSSRKHVCFAFIARTIPMSLRKAKLCQQRLPQFGVSSPSCKGSKIRHVFARAARLQKPLCRILYLSILHTMCNAGLAAVDAVVPVNCDFCTAKCERYENEPHVIAESRRLCVRRTHRAKAEETARHRRAIGAA